MRQVGVEFPGFPGALAPTADSQPIVVADMSSNILSRRIQIRNYSVVFFGAQKNIGSTGITVVVITIPSPWREPRTLAISHRIRTVVV